MSRPSALMAQPQVISTTPAHQATGVSLTTTIDVVTNAKLLQSHISPTMPRVDSVADYKQPCIYIATSSLYDTLEGNASYLSRAGLYGAISVLNDSTIRLTLSSGQLKYEETYKAKIAHLKALVPNQNGFDTVDVQEYSFSFTMIEGPHRVISYSIQNERYIRKNDTLKVMFNRSLLSTTTTNGSIAEIEKFTGYTIIDSASVIDNYSNVDANLSLSSDGKTLFVKPLIFNSDTTYRLKVNLGYLTGDSLDNFRKDFYLKDHGTITLQVANADTTQPLPTFVKPNQGLRSWAMKVGDTLRLSAPEELSHYHFIKWVSPNLSVLNNNTNSTINYTFGFGNIDDYTITAVFAETQKDTVEITPANPVGGKFIVQNFADSLGNGIYTFYKSSHNRMMIIALPDSGKVFSTFTSSNYPLGNSERQSHTLGIKSRTSFSMNGQRFNIGHNGFTDIVVIPPGGGGPISGCSSHVVRIEIVGGNGLLRVSSNPIIHRANTEFDPFVIPPTPNVTPIASLLPEKTDLLWTQTVVDGNRRVWRLEQADEIEQPYSITCNPGYVIQRVTLNGELLVGGEDEAQALTAHSYTIRANLSEGCTQRLEVFIRKEVRRLIVEKAGKNGTQVDQSFCNIDVSYVDMMRNLDFQTIDKPESYQQEVGGQMRNFTKFVTRYFFDHNESTSAFPSTRSGGENYNKEGWLNAPDYTSGPHDANHLLSPIVMSANRLIQYQWSSDFYVQELVQVVIDPAGNKSERTYRVSPAGVVLDRQDYLLRHVSINPPDGTVQVKLVFNRSIDPSSVYGKINAYDHNTKRLDGRRDGVNHVLMHYPGNMQNISVSGNVVTFFLRAMDGSIPYNMHEIRMVLSNNIQSNDNPPLYLRNGFENFFKTAYPSVSVDINSIKLLKNMDPGVPGTYADIRLTPKVYLLTHNEKGKAIVPAESDVSIPILGIYSMDLNATEDINYAALVSFVPKNDQDVLAIQFEAYDKDCGEDLPTETLTALKTAAIAKMAVDIAAGIVPWKWIGIGLIAELAKYSIETSCADDQMSFISKTYGISDEISRFWGGNTSVDPTFSLTNGPVFWKTHTLSNEFYEMDYKVTLRPR
ncbi:MAG: hypothetical protein ACK6BZ_04600 [Candidatus Kapaibacterium sp.]